jgi:hypothetical protein
MMTKEKMAEAILALPDDATIRDAIEQLEFIEWVQKRVAEADADPEGWVSHEEARRRFAEWLQ